MSEMVERVARALARSAGGKITGPSRHRASDEFPWDPSHRYMEKYVDAHWKEHVHAATFAIEAMRDPSSCMMQAMYEAMFVDKWDGTQAAMIGAGFEAAIDAALSSPAIHEE